MEAARDARQLWEYTGSDRALLSEIEAAYETLIARDDADETNNLINRAMFLRGIFDHAGAVEDFNAALAIAEDAETLRWRGWELMQMGKLEASLADYRRVEELDAGGGTLFNQAIILGLLDRQSEIAALMEEAQLVAESDLNASLQEAHMLGWQGRAGEGLAILQEEHSLNSENPTLDNSVCWHAAMWDLITPDTFAYCTDAVEKGASSVAALDSRAMAYYRMGEFNLALADLDKVIERAPDLMESRYLRGVIRSEQGLDGGAEDIAIATVARPVLRSEYGAYGIGDPEG